jgi:hypothetical protein
VKGGWEVGKAGTAGGGAAAILAAAWTNSQNEDVSAFLEAAGFILVGVWLTMVVVDWHRGKHDDDGGVS